MAPCSSRLSACSPSRPAPSPPPIPAEGEIPAESLVATREDAVVGRVRRSCAGDERREARHRVSGQAAGRLGLEPAGDNGTFFQQVPIVESTVERTFTLSVPGNTYRYSADIVAFSGVERARVQVQGDVVFVGHGIVAPELKWNDYEGANVKGKWVLIMVNDPPAPPEEPTLFGGPALTYYGRWTYKFEEAARQGAAGALLIHTDESATYPWQVVQSSWTGTQYSLPPAEGAPALGIKAWMTESAARDLAKRGGQNLDTIREAARKRGFKAVPLSIRAAATLQQKSARKTAPNVIAKITGTGANDQQAVVFTSHWDHFGIREPQPDDKPDADRIFNGAYDNASGCAGLLEIAKAMARASEKPGRSMYFVFTTAEESGLLGSEYFAAASADPAGADGRQHQCRRHQLSRADARHGAARRRSIVARSDGGGAAEGTRPRAGAGHASGARLLLPIRPLPAGQRRCPGAVDQRTQRVHGTAGRRRCSRSRKPTTAPTITSRATSTTRRGTSAARVQDLRAAVGAGVAHRCGAADAVL